jgi:hypothetical protein
LELLKKLHDYLYLKDEFVIQVRKKDKVGRGYNSKKKDYNSITTEC